VVPTTEPPPARTTDRGTKDERGRGTENLDPKADGPAHGEGGKGDRDDSSDGKGTGGGKGQD